MMPKKLFIFRLFCLMTIFWGQNQITSAMAIELQSVTPVPTPPPDRGLDAKQQDAIRELIKTLEDKQSRQHLVKDLQTLLMADSRLSPKQDPSPWGLKTVSETLHSITSKIFEFFDQLQFSNDRLSDYLDDEVLSPIILDTFYKVVGIFILCFMVDSALKWGQRALRPAFMMNARHHRLQHRRLILNVVIIEFLISMILFIILGTGLYWIQPTSISHDILRTILTTAFSYVILLHIIRTFFHRKNRLVTIFYLNSSTRTLVYKFLRFILLTSALGIGMGHVISDIQGPAIFYTTLTKTILLSQCFSSISFVLRVKEQVRQWLVSGKRFTSSNNELSKLYGRAVRTWHLWAIIYILIFGLTTYFQTIHDIREVITSFVTTASLVTVAYLLILKMPAMTHNMLAKVVNSFPHIGSRHRFYGIFVSLFLSIFIIVVMLYGAFKIWDIESIDFLFSDGVKPIFATILNLFFIIIIGVILWETNEYLIQQIFNRDTKTYKDRVRRQRLATMMPLIQIISRGLILGIFVIMAFSELKLDVTPLLAGLGVISLAFTFGSQSLVKDFITGIFILIEDTMNVGDIVQIDSQKGTVETLSLRTVKLRDTAGNLHTISFSTISRVTNMTKNFAYYVIEIVFPFEQSLEPALEIIREIDEEMRADSKFKNYILSSVEIMGLDRFTDLGAAVLARVKTVPDKNRWVVGREYNLRIKQTFNNCGIRFSTSAPPLPSK